MFEDNIQELVQRVFVQDGPAPVYHVLIGIQHPGRDLDLEFATGYDNALKRNVRTTDSFRLGSITKIFTALVVFQLSEERKLKPEDPFLDHFDPADRDLISAHLRPGNEKFVRSIRIRDLLNHTSGLADYVMGHPDFVDLVKKRPEKLWHWKDILNAYHHMKMYEKALDKGTFHYSDTNYVLLAALIERIDGCAYHEALKKRILIPSGMAETWLEYYQSAPKGTHVLSSYRGADRLDPVNRSFDWGGGGLVSTLSDMQTFGNSLVKGLLIRDRASLDHLWYTVNAHGYAHGIQQRKVGNIHWFGHNSSYGSGFNFDPESGISICLTIDQSNALIKAEWLMKKLMELVR